MDKPALPKPISNIDSVFDSLHTVDDTTLDHRIDFMHTTLTSQRRPSLDDVPGWLLTIYRVLAWIRQRLGAHDEMNAALRATQQSMQRTIDQQGQQIGELREDHTHLTRVIADIQRERVTEQQQERERDA